MELMNSRRDTGDKVDVRRRALTPDDDPMGGRVENFGGTAGIGPRAEFLGKLDGWACRFAREIPTFHPRDPLMKSHACRKESFKTNRDSSGGNRRIHQRLPKQCA